MGKSKNILKGKFPKKLHSLDEQVELVNRASAHILEAFQDSNEEKVDRQVNNLALWLGGLHPDIQVYAFQLLLKRHKISFDADDKTEARMARLEERIENSIGYVQHTYQDINHYPWPVEFLDGTTFEDRLEDLANEVREEQALDIVTVDMVLTGVHQSRIEDISQCYAVVVDCVEHIKQPFAVGRQEQIQRFNSWLEHQIPDMKVFGQSLVNKIT